MPTPRSWRFEVRLIHQLGGPGKFAWLVGTARDGTGQISGELGELVEMDAFGGSAIGGMREVAAGHELDFQIERVVVHLVDSHPRDFVQALLAVGRSIRGHGEPVSSVRKLVVEPLG